MCELGDRRLRSRAACVLAALLASTVGASVARADPPPPEEEQDRQTLRGLGTALNFRGVSNEVDSDLTHSTGPSRSPVLALRLSARMLVLPALNEATTSWGGFVGIRTAGFQFGKPSGSDDATPGGFIPANVQPTIGVLIESIADEVRFEADVAPVISLAQSSELASQAAIMAALSTSPHDDLLFVPNVQGGARLRLALSRRFRLTQQVSWSIGAEVQTGYAKAASSIGTSQGRTGGGALDVRLIVRLPWRSVESIDFDGFADVGYTAVWAANVVLPMLLGGGVTVAFNRLFEAGVRVSRFAANPIGSGSFDLDSWATTLGVRWSFGAEPRGWTQHQIDLEPELGTQDGNR